jgi:TetR/AcrR family transcriptional regulator, cholesterol catabolism regulator
VISPKSIKETCEPKKVSLVLPWFCKNMKNKEKILTGAKELFYKYGIKNITMDEIARHLAISKKTIYFAFPDKDNLVNSLMLRDLKANHKEFDEIFEKSENVVDEVFTIMKKMTEIFSNCNPVMYYDLQKFYPQTWKLFTDFREKFILSHVERSIESGKKDGLVRLDANTKILAHLRMEEIAMALSGTTFPQDKFNMLDVQLMLAEHFLYGICTLKGHKLINKYKEINEEE